MDIVSIKANKEAYNKHLKTNNKSNVNVKIIKLIVIV